MASNKFRDYEVSVWSLQDDFITVLKPAGIEYKGRIREPDMTVDVDGTQEFTFSIPMYLTENNKRIENPAWYHYLNGIIIADLRKIKVILNKATEDEEVFEFIIVKVFEKHEKEELTCEVNCEGLAFHELGKTGYKISLESQKFYNDVEDFYTNGKWTNPKGVDSVSEPIANLQYWCDQFLTPYINDGTYKNPREWYYQINMDWSSYSRITKQGEVQSRSSDTIYEEEYVASWEEIGSGDIQIRPSAIEAYQEKARLVDLTESNKYNLTQDLAETFGVYCKYIYEHDSTYHITGRRIIFYNNFIEEDKGPIDINYRYNTTSISREMDGTDIVTKMYVRPVDNSISPSGTISIMDSEVNKSKEDYLLNFDYLHGINAISDDLYEYTKSFEDDIRLINLKMIPLEQIIMDLQNKLTEAKAKETLFDEAKKLDNEEILKADKLIHNILDKHGVDYEYLGKTYRVLEVSKSNPEPGLLLKDNTYVCTNEAKQLHYLKLSKQGIFPETIKIFRNRECTDEKEIVGWTIEYGEFNDVVKIKNLTPDENLRKQVYLTYKYSEQLYYEKVKDVWEKRLAKDTLEYEEAHFKVEAYNNLLDAREEEYSSLVIEKNQKIAEFERELGPALREGYWQPEDYTDYGDQHINEFDLSTDSSIFEGSGDNLSSMLWDNMLFDEEQKLYFERGVDQIKVYYPCIDLSSIQDKLFNEIIDIDFLYQDFNAGTYTSSEISEDETTQSLVLGSKSQLVFLRKKSNNKVIPALMLVGAENMSDEEINFIQSRNCALGKIAVTVNADGTDVNIDKTISCIVPALGNSLEEGEIIVTAPATYSNSNDNNSNNENNNNFLPLVHWINPTDIGNLYEIVYPRIKISSLMVKTNDSQLFVKSGENLFKNNDDFYILTRVGGEYYARFDGTIRIDANGQEIEPEFHETNKLMDYEEATYITIKPDALFRKSIKFIVDENNEEKQIFQIKISYNISNASTSIYLDAIQVLKDSSIPQVSYEVNVGLVQKEYIKTIYKMLNRIVHINDYELKFNYVQGYISQVSLSLDSPQNDKITIKNYKTKFEDLFTKIVAATEQMKKSEYINGVISQAFTPEGNLNPDTLDNLDYYSSNGELIIDSKKGIWGLSDRGAIAFLNRGIFTATEKDNDEHWKWNTAISPEGINADLIKTGQLDTNRIKIYSGDQLRFQWNGEGLYAYKDYQNFSSDEFSSNINDEIDSKQYALMNDDGFFLVAEAGAKIYKEEDEEEPDFVNSSIPDDPFNLIRTINQLPAGVDRDNYFIHHSENSAEYTEIQRTVKRVSISWNGLVLRDYTGMKTFYADPDTGSLTITGTIRADRGQIGPWTIDKTGLKYEKNGSVYAFFGPEGLNFNNIFKIQMTQSILNGTSPYDTFDKFGIYDNDNNYLFEVSRDYLGSAEGYGYSFNIQNVNLQGGIIDNILSQAAKEIVFSDTVSSSNNTPIFPEENVKNGYLGVFYSNGTQSNVPMSFQNYYNRLNYSDVYNFPYIGFTDYGKSGHQSATYFGITASRWNVGTLSGDPDSILPYSRVGIASTTSNKCAAFGIFTASNGGVKNDTFSLTFNYYLKYPGALRDVEERTNRPNISVSCFMSENNSYVPITQTEIFTPISGDITTKKTGTVTFSLTKDVPANKDIYIVFYSFIEHSLIYIDLVNVTMTGITTNGNNYGLYVRSNNIWCPLFSTLNPS